MVGETTLLNITLWEEVLALFLSLGLNFNAHFIRKPNLRKVIDDFKFIPIWDLGL